MCGGEIDLYPIYKGKDEAFCCVWWACFVYNKNVSGRERIEHGFSKSRSTGWIQTSELCACRRGHNVSQPCAEPQVRITATTGRLRLIVKVDDGSAPHGGPNILR